MRHIYEVIKKKYSKDHENKLTSSINDLMGQQKNSTGDAKIALDRKINVLQTELSREKESTIVMNKLLTYGSFMSAIAMAKSSDQVEEAIETFALPTGSARIK